MSKRQSSCFNSSLITHHFLLLLARHLSLVTRHCFMKITSAEFVKSSFTEEDWPRNALPEVAFLGRSNVGKSSLINSLLGVKGLARTSNTPGRTQLINFFMINEAFYFVDLPGYGYAR